MESPQDQEQARCAREIAEIEALLRAGDPDVDGLALALADWRAELELLRTATI